MSGRVSSRVGMGGAGHGHGLGRGWRQAPHCQQLCHRAWGRQCERQQHRCPARRSPRMGTGSGSRRRPPRCLGGASACAPSSAAAASPSPSPPAAAAATAAAAALRLRARRRPALASAGSASSAAAAAADGSSAASGTAGSTASSAAVVDSALARRRLVRGAAVLPSTTSTARPAAVGTRPLRRRPAGAGEPAASSGAGGGGVAGCAPAALPGWVPLRPMAAERAEKKLSLRAGQEGVEAWSSEGSRRPRAARTAPAAAAQRPGAEEHRRHRRPLAALPAAGVATRVPSHRCGRAGGLTTTFRLRPHMPHLRGSPAHPGVAPTSVDRPDRGAAVRGRASRARIVGRRRWEPWAALGLAARRRQSIHECGAASVCIMARVGCGFSPPAAALRALPTAACTEPRPRLALMLQHGRCSFARSSMAVTLTLCTHRSAANWLPEPPPPTLTQHRWKATSRSGVEPACPAGVRVVLQIGTDKSQMGTDQAWPLAGGTLVLCREGLSRVEEDRSRGYRRA